MAASTNNKAHLSFGYSRGDVIHRIEVTSTEEIGPSDEESLHLAISSHLGRSQGAELLWAHRIERLESALAALK